MGGHCITGMNVFRGGQDDADHSAQAGEQVMQQTIYIIGVVNREIAGTAAVIRDLEHDSARIGKVLEVITLHNELAKNDVLGNHRLDEIGIVFEMICTQQ